MDPALFQNDVEKNQHENALEALCDRYPDRRDEISSAYEQQLTEQLPDAAIRSYLPIFITKKIERNYRSTG